MHFFQYNSFPENARTRVPIGPNSFSKFKFRGGIFADSRNLRAQIVAKAKASADNTGF